MSLHGGTRYRYRYRYRYEDMAVITTLRQMEEYYPSGYITTQRFMKENIYEESNF